VVLFGVLAVVAVLVVLAVSWFLASPQDDDKVTVQLGRVTGALRDLLIIGLLSGACGMAVVQFRKNLLSVRGRYHVDYLRNHFGPAWPQLARLASGSLGRGGVGESSQPEPEASDFASDKAYAAYLRQRLAPPSKEVAPATSEAPDERALERALVRQWDAPTEQVVAQVARVSEFVMARPRGNVRVLRRFVGADASEVVDRLVLAMIEPAPPVRADDLAFEVRHHVEQNLDALLLAMRSRWTRRVRLEVVFAAGVLGGASLVFSDVGPLVKTSAIIVAVVFGGVFGWLTRDVIAVVEKWRA
jgi:hypothetical protein